MVFSLLRSWLIAALCMQALAVLSVGLRAETTAQKRPDCANLTDEIHALHRTMQPALSSLPIQALNRRERDSLERMLREEYASLHFGNDSGDALKAIVRSLILLYLGQTGVQNAFQTALSMLASAAKSSAAPCPQSAWIRGLLLLESGALFDGVYTLDSLRETGFDDEEFLSDYARSFFYAVVPKKTDTLRLFVRDGTSLQPADTASPDVFQWNIITSQKSRVPFFEFEAAFSFRKQFSLDFSGFTSGKSRPALLRYGSNEPQSAASAHFIEQLSQRIDSAWCAIHLDISDAAVSPFEYLLKRINGIYDSIAVKADLPHYNAISLRCYNWRLWGREGARTAYIVFDRTLADLSRAPYPPKPIRAKDANRRIRFTITMRSGEAVEAQAEAKLQSVLKAF